jgi:hypothetical protein
MMPGVTASASGVVSAIITAPTSLDILCGQSKECRDFPGSRRYRSLIDSFRHKYSSAASRLEKMAITMDIFSFLQRANSRFLRYNEELGGWEEVPFLAARDKIGHALRFANRLTAKPRCTKKNNHKTTPDNPDDAHPPQQRLQDMTANMVAALGPPAAATPITSGSSSSWIPSSSSNMDSSQKVLLDQSLNNAPGTTFTVSYLLQKYREANNLSVQIESAPKHQDILTPENRYSSRTPAAAIGGPSRAHDRSNELPWMSQPRRMVSQCTPNVALRAVPCELQGQLPLHEQQDKKPAAFQASKTKCQKAPGGRSPKNLAFAAALRARALQTAQSHFQKQATNVAPFCGGTPVQEPQATALAAVSTGNNVSYLPHQSSNHAGVVRKAPVHTSRVTMQLHEDMATTESLDSTVWEESNFLLPEAFRKTMGGPMLRNTAAPYTKNPKMRVSSCKSSPPLPIVIITHDPPSGSYDLSLDLAAPVQKNSKFSHPCCPDDPAKSSDSLSGSEHWSILRESIDDWESDHASAIS